MKRGILWVAVLSLFGVGGVWTVHAATFNSTNFSINGNLGDSAAGGQSSTNYQLTSAGGESIAGSSSSASYKLGQGYISTLENSIQVTVQPNGLVAYYPFDESSGDQAYNAADSVAGSLKSSVAAVWNASGKVGGATTTSSGAGRYFDITSGNTAFDFLNATSAMSVSGWYKTSGTGNQKIVWRDNNCQGWNIGLDGSNQLTSTLAVSPAGCGGENYTTVDDVATTNDNTWHQFTVIYDRPNSNVLLYRDGVLRDTTAISSNVGASNGGTFRVGVDWQGLTGFSGDLDEIKVFNKVLSASEIKAEYDAGVSAIAAGLSLPALTPGQSQTALFDALTQTSSPGYTLAINQNANLTSGGNTIPSVSGSIGSPVTWNEGSTKGLGFTLYGTNATAIPGTWNSGAAYAAIPGSATTFYTRSGYNGGAKDVLNMRLRLDALASQAIGDYSNQITITGTMTP